MHSLACNHALVDGNKRLALLATVVFLRIHGYALDLTDDEAFDLTMSVAAGQLDADGIRSGFDSRKPPVTPRFCVLARLRLHIRFWLAMRYVGIPGALQARPSHEVQRLTC